MRTSTGLLLATAAGLVLTACVIGGRVAEPGPIDQVNLTITVASDRVIAPTSSGKADAPLPNDATAGNTLATAAHGANVRADRRADVAGGPGRCELDHVISGTPPPSHPLYVQKG